MRLSAASHNITLCNDIYAFTHTLPNLSPRDAARTEESLFQPIRSLYSVSLISQRSRSGWTEQAITLRSITESDIKVWMTCTLLPLQLYCVRSCCERSRGGSSLAKRANGTKMFYCNRWKEGYRRQPLPFQRVIWIQKVSAQYRHDILAAPKIRSQ